MGLKPDEIDEIDETSRPLVEVPIPLSDRVAWVVLGVFWAGTVPMMVGALSLHRLDRATFLVAACTDSLHLAPRQSRGGQTLPGSGESPPVRDRERWVTASSWTRCSWASL